MESIRYEVDPQWIGLAPPLQYGPSILGERLEQALLSFPTPDGAEDAKRARRHLLRHGLAEDRDSTPMAKYIYNSLLHGPSHSFRLTLADQKSIEVPTRSNLLLALAAQQLGINIYLFSSRASPIAFKATGATNSVGFFHHIDSITSTSRFWILGATPSAPNPVPVGRGHPPPFSSEFGRATFRIEGRKPNRLTKRKGDDLDDDEVKAAFKKVCRESMSSHARACMVKGQGLEATKNKLIREERSGLPKGVRKRAFEDVRASFEEAKTLSDDVLKRKLGKDGDVSAWNSLVRTVFDEIWEAEAAK
ncbi:hypothetical protein BGW38_006871, partial [Lunasporangiospora selenospora]